MMKGLVEAMGARCVDYGLEQLCCGFPISQFDKNAALKERLLPKLKALSTTNAEALAFCCPACLNQFETGQGGAGDLGADVAKYPCVHVLELLALALGMPAAELSLDFRSRNYEGIFRVFLGMSSDLAHLADIRGKCL